MIKKGLDGCSKNKEDRSFETLQDNYNLKKYLIEVEKNKLLDSNAPQKIDLVKERSQETLKRKNLQALNHRSINIFNLRADNKNLQKVLDESQLFNDYIAQPEKSRAEKESKFESVKFKLSQLASSV